MIDHGANGGEEGGVEQVSAHEVGREGEQEQRQVEGAERRHPFGRLGHVGGRCGGVGRGDCGAGEGCDGPDADQGQHAPEWELGESDESDADDLTRHQVEGPYGGDHQLDDAVRLLFRHALHDHRPVEGDEHVDGQGEDDADDVGQLGGGGALGAVVVQLDGADLVIHAAVTDDLLEVGDAIGGHLVVLHALAERLVD